MSSHVGSFILSHSKRLMNDVTEQIGGLYKNSLYHTDTDSLYIHKKYWSSLADKGFVGKSPGLNKNDYGNFGIFYAWFLAPNLKYCSVIDNFGVNSAKRTFKGYSEEHRMIKLDKNLSLSERKTVSGRFLIDCSEIFEGIKKPPKKTSLFRL